jgi:hypothetical protein
MKSPLKLIFATALLAGSSQAALISGPGQITASTTIDFAGGFGSIEQIADGVGLNVDGNPFNGYGPNASSGTITLTLNGTFTLYDFYLANDINVDREGAREFQLSFYDANDTLITTTGTLTGPLGSIPAVTYNLGEINGVSRVDFHILNVYTENLQRIEIREVAFNGIQQVPEPSAALLAGISLLAFARRRR